MTRAPHPPLLERDLDESLLPARGEKVALSEEKGRIRGDS